MYNITRNMNELEEKCLRFVLRHYQKNKLDTRQALKVFKEKHGVVGRAGGKNRYFLFLSGLAAAILLAFIVWGVYLLRSSGQNWQHTNMQ